MLFGIILASEAAVICCRKNTDKEMPDVATAKETATATELIIIGYNSGAVFSTPLARGVGGIRRVRK